MKPCFHVIEHGQFLKQADILEGTRHARFIDLNRLFADQIFAVQQNNAVARLIDARQQVKYRRLARAVRTD